MEGQGRVDAAEPLTEAVAEQRGAEAHQALIEADLSVGVCSVLLWVHVGELWPFKRVSFPTVKAWLESLKPSLSSFALTDERRLGDVGRCLGCSVLATLIVGLSASSCRSERQRGRNEMRRRRTDEAKEARKRRGEEWIATRDAAPATKALCGEAHERTCECVRPPRREGSLRKRRE